MATGTLATTGGLKLPLPTVADSLHEADRLLNALHGLIRAAINAELAGDSDAVQTGSPWAVITTTVDKLTGSLPVAATTFRSPTPAHLREATKSFPLLAIYRTGEQGREDYSTETQSLWSGLQLDYLLPPLSAEGVQRVAGVLPVISRIVQRVLRTACHPAHQGGVAVLRDETLAISIEVTGTIQYGPAQLGDQGQGTEYWALSIPLLAHEVIDDDADLHAPPITGGVFDLSYAQGTVTIDVDTNPGP